MEKFIITEVEMKRYKVLSQVVEGNLTLKEASQLLGLSYRHILRLKKRFIQNGLEGLLRKDHSTPPNLNFNLPIIKHILNLRKQLYYDFNVLHFKDKLREVHDISISYERLRQILIKEGLHEPRRRKNTYRRRRRMPSAGLLVQMDSSQHRWLKDIKEPWWLVAMCDDADGYVYAEFHPKETTPTCMQVIKKFIQERGLFMALYVDKASHFKTIRHGGLHYELAPEHKDTQIQRALRQLNIEMIYANSPQAKGRIERLFRFFQDRLIKEMRLRKIKTYAQANNFLNQEFLPWYNKNYTLKLKNTYQKLPQQIDLNLIFSIRNPRKVNNDNTISYEGNLYQLLPYNGLKNFKGKWVEVCKLLNGNLEIMYEEKIIPYLRIGKDKKKTLTKKEEILSTCASHADRNKRRYLTDKPKKQYTPPKNHPWRKFCYLRNVTSQISNKI